MILFHYRQQFSALLFHLPRWFLTPFVIETNQVQDAVDQKAGNHTVEGNTCLFGLPLGCGEGNDNVTKEFWRNFAELPFTHGKGQNISGTLAFSILPVERTHLRIIH